jgi:cobalt-zinc-cadmium efflux system outer membrane protein
LAAQARADAARFSVQEQQARRVEDIGAGFSYSRERTLDDPNPLATDRVVGFRVTLPLPLWNNNAGRVYEASAAAARAEREVDAAVLAAGGETESARQAMEAYAKIFAALDAAALPQAIQLEEQLRVSHANGQTPLMEVLRTRSRRLELQRQRLDVLRDYHLARIRHSSATNQPSPSK